MITTLSVTSWSKGSVRIVRGREGALRMTLASLLTLSRIFLIPVFMALVLTRTGENWALVVFIVAAVTDGLDGYVAHARKEITKFGQLMDPIADKLLVSSALIAMVELGQISSWVVMIILGREFAVSGLRMVVASEGILIPARFLGKAQDRLPDRCDCRDSSRFRAPLSSCGWRRASPSSRASTTFLKRKSTSGRRFSASTQATKRNGAASPLLAWVRVRPRSCRRGLFKL